MQETLHDHHTSISIGGRPVCNLRFVDDIDLMGSSSGELQDFTNRLAGGATAYGMEVSIEKSKVITNSTNLCADISMNDQKLEEVTSFKHLGAFLCRNDTCSAEIRIRIASAVVSVARLNRIWRSNTMKFAGKFKFYKSLASSIIFYGCKTRILLADCEKRI